MMLYLSILLLGLCGSSMRLVSSVCTDNTSIGIEVWQIVDDPPELVDAIKTDSSARTPDQIALVQNRINELQSKLEASIPGLIVSKIVLTAKDDSTTHDDRVKVKIELRGSYTPIFPPRGAFPPVKPTGSIERTHQEVCNLFLANLGKSANETLIWNDTQVFLGGSKC